MSLLNLSVLSIIFLIGCSLANLQLYSKRPVDRIVGGHVTSIKDNPWQVSTHYNDTFYCGGSIIGNKWILTAAHCAEATLNVLLNVRVGSSQSGSGGKIMKVTRIIRNPKVDVYKNDYDVTLLELAEALTYTDDVQPIKLVASNAEIADGTECLTSGWGETMEVTENGIDILRAVNVPIVNDYKCYRQYEIEGVRITPRMICAGWADGGKNACYGDSGGSLSCVVDSSKPILVGVASFLIGCATGFPVVYTRISDPEIRDWIKTETGI